MLTAVHINHKLTCSVVSDMVYHTVHYSAESGLAAKVLKVLL
jgi:hypothetical protein